MNFLQYFDFFNLFHFFSLCLPQPLYKIFYLCHRLVGRNLLLLYIFLGIWSFLWPPNIRNWFFLLWISILLICRISAGQRSLLRYPHIGINRRYYLFFTWLSRNNFFFTYLSGKNFLLRNGLWNRGQNILGFWNFRSW